MQHLFGDRIWTFSDNKGTREREKGGAANILPFMLIVVDECQCELLVNKFVCK